MGAVVLVGFLVVMTVMTTLTMKNSKKNVPDAPEIRRTSLSSVFSIVVSFVIAILCLVFALFMLASGLEGISKHENSGYFAVGFSFFLVYFAERFNQFMADHIRGIVFDPSKKIIEIPWLGLIPFKTGRVIIATKDIKKVSRWLETTLNAGKYENPHTHKLNIITVNKAYEIKCGSDLRADAAEQLIHEAMQHQ